MISKHLFEYWNSFKDLYLFDSKLAKPYASCVIQRLTIQWTLWPIYQNHIKLEEMSQIPTGNLLLWDYVYRYPKPKPLSPLLKGEKITDFTEDYTIEKRAFFV